MATRIATSRPSAPTSCVTLRAAHRGRTLAAGVGGKSFVKGRPACREAAGSIDRMPTAVVTGGAGFLGSHLCDALVAEGLSGGLRGQGLDPGPPSRPWSTFAATGLSSSSITTSPATSRWTRSKTRN